jgi:DUF4097 and DUF4098 domain-containing protein YvlB
MSELRSPRRVGAWCAALALLLLLPGCDLPLFTASETVSEVFETSATPRVVIETFNGSIDVSNGEDDEVVVEVTKRAGGFDQPAAERNLDQIEIAAVEDANEIRVSVRRVGHMPGNCGASVVVAAPKTAQIVLKTSNGYVVSEGMQGGIDAVTSNARIEVYEAAGDIEADSSNGSIHIEATDAVVDAQTSNARVEFEGSLADKSHRFRTSNGRIEVTLPPDSRFRFEASTSNGGIDCDFPFDDDASRSRRKKSGTVGENPACLLKLSTSNSSIDIRRAD